MSKTFIKNASVVLPDRVEKQQTVVVENGRFTRIGHLNDIEIETGSLAIDAQGHYLAPGFIDLHIHGTGKFLIDRGPVDLAEICKTLSQYGVTGFLAGVCPRPKGEDAIFLRSLAKVDSSGCKMLGFHLEGPFLSITGALPPESLGDSDAGRVRNLIEAAQPFPVVFSISPEFEGIADIIPIMAETGAPVFITHTKANVEETLAAIEKGACHATHFYDVFYPPDETDPGVRPCGAVEAILADERVSVDFILDGEHVDPIAVKAALRCKGPDKVCLITDANIGAGLPPGKYEFVGSEVEFQYPGGPARMTENSPSPGSLAGSGLSLDRAVRNATKMLDVDLPLAIRMASTNPATVLGLSDRKGKIQEGYDADFVIMDKSLNVRQTWIDGNCVYKKQE